MLVLVFSPEKRQKKKLDTKYQVCTDKRLTHIAELKEFSYFTVAAILKGQTVCVWGGGRVKNNKTVLKMA